MVEIKAKNPEKVLKGKKSRAQGADFEKRVRADLESKNFIVDKWSNNVEFGHTDTHDGKFVPVKWKDLTLKNGDHYPGPVARLVQAKPKFLFIKGRMQMVGNSSGFPDFVVWHKDLNLQVEKQLKGQDHHCVGTFAVESKMTGILDAEEKEKCRWLLRNKIFTKILIASKTKVKNRIVIDYKEFEP